MLHVLISAIIIAPFTRLFFEKYRSSSLHGLFSVFRLLVGGNQSCVTFVVANSNNHPKSLCILFTYIAIQKLANSLLVLTSACLNLPSFLCFLDILFGLCSVLSSRTSWYKKLLLRHFESFLSICLNWKFTDPYASDINFKTP